MKLISASSPMHECPDVLHYSMKITVPFNLRCAQAMAGKTTHCSSRKAGTVNAMIESKICDLSSCPLPWTDQCNSANFQNVCTDDSAIIVPSQMSSSCSGDKFRRNLCICTSLPIKIFSSSSSSRWSCTIWSDPELDLSYGSSGKRGRAEFVNTESVSVRD